MERLESDYLPDALEVHRTNLDNVPYLFALEDTVAASASHARDVEEFGTINHVVVWGASARSG